MRQITIIFSRIYRFLLTSAAFMLLVSCGHSGNNSIILPSIQTIAWQLDGNGFVQYYTNDAQYLGYGFFHAYAQTDESQMSTVTATVKKQSGSLSSGYGIVFCYKDSNNFYRLLITTTGHYCVHAKTGGTYSTIIPWTATPSLHLNVGTGVENEISVTEQTLNHFTVYFNGMFETTFSDANFSGGSAGFYLGVSPTTENFPYIPEDVRFKLSSPVIYP